MASRPVPGADAVVVFLGGDRSAGVVVATGHRIYQGPALAEGEVAIYSHEGVAITVKLGKEVRVTGADKVNIAAAVQAVIDCPDIRLGDASASKAVKLADGSNATKVKAV